MRKLSMSSKKKPKKIASKRTVLHSKFRPVQNTLEVRCFSRTIKLTLFKGTFFYHVCSLERLRFKFNAVLFLPIAKEERFSSSNVAK